MIFFQDMNWNSAKAAGRHVLTYAAGAVSFAVVSNLISAPDAATINQNIGFISDGLASIVKGVVGIATVVIPMYTAWRSAHSAAPTQQIAAVNALPDVAGVITKSTPEGRALADSIPSKTVVSEGTIAAGLVAAPKT